MKPKDLIRYLGELVDVIMVNGKVYEVRESKWNRDHQDAIFRTRVGGSITRRLGAKARR
ncbi:MAG: hypothetical protein ACETWE_08105 [Candidatus Bathyarchaeia archaeon]